MTSVINAVVEEYGPEQQQQALWYGDAETLVDK
jgi:hypothetical protein